MDNVDGLIETGDARAASPHLRQIHRRVPREEIERPQLELVPGRGHDGPVLEQLYFTLYLGVVAQWSRDPSPHQEDTLALLDQSLILFCSTLQTSAPAPQLASEDQA